MKFGELLDEYRNNLGLSINKLGELANVSPTYISRLQNNPGKKPSKKILFKILNALFIETANQEIKTTHLFSDFITNYLYDDKNEFSDYDINQVQKLLDEFFEYNNKWNNHKRKKLYSLSESIEKNRVIYQKNQQISFTNNKEDLQKHLYNKPIFDLDWYLKQNDFEILFPRELITNSNYEDIDYNVLTENDKKMILNLVHAYMNTKYTKIQNKQEFFDKNFDLFIARMSDVELQSFEYKNE